MLNSEIFNENLDDESYKEIYIKRKPHGALSKSKGKGTSHTIDSCGGDGKKPAGDATTAKNMLKYALTDQCGGLVHLNGHDSIDDYKKQIVHYKTLCKVKSNRVFLNSATNFFHSIVKIIP
jgi:hypothetical protein